MPESNPSIPAEIARRVFCGAAVRAARHREVAAERAALDEAELHDLEQLEYYGRSPTAAHARKRNLLDRIRRR
ncbi:MAG: hypothetical protein EPO36_04175 [Chloroflexota bacterium]|nr:MAG: hypothetical protein EPO36_04175 [Chloroflexota bacterium]